MGIVHEKIIIKVHGTNISHYKNLGYIIEKGIKFLEINTIDLPDNSHVNVDFKCDG